MTDTTWVSRETRRPAPWAWLLVGVLSVPALAPPEPLPAPDAWLVEELGPAAPNLERSGVRTLRRLPAIGDRRALKLVRARRGHDPRDGPLALDDVRGIGPVTVRRVAHAIGIGAGEGEVPRLWLSPADGATLRPR